MVLVEVACLVGDILSQQLGPKPQSLTVTGLDGPGGDKGARSA